MRLSNSRPLKQWKDPESGELYVWVVIETKDLLAMNNDLSGRVVKKTLDEADAKHDKTIKETFNEEFQKQFSN